MPKAIEDCVVLYVEDDDATAYLLQIAMREAQLQPQVFRVRRGDEALAFLRRAGAYGAAPEVDLVLLDLNLPGRSGFDVLAQIRSMVEFAGLPVHVFSTSDNPSDRKAAADAGATGYLVKGDTFENFIDVARAVCSSLC